MNEMTDLDRKIAELKGFPIIHEKELMGTKFEFATNSDGEGLKSVGGKWWSTDIAQAFELVDEVGESFRFSLSNCVTGPLGKQLPGAWLATFSHSWTAKAGGIHAGSGVARTRSEAICRAYIALKEWEGKKKNENCTECKEPERLYKVLTDWRMSDVIQKLSDHIREGWEPLGKIESKRGSYSDGGVSEWHEIHIWKKSASNQTTKLRKC